MDPKEQSSTYLKIRAAQQKHGENRAQYFEIETKGNEIQKREVVFAFGLPSKPKWHEENDIHELRRVVADAEEGELIQADRSIFVVPFDSTGRVPAAFFRLNPAAQVECLAHGNA